MDFEHFPHVPTIHIHFPHVATTHTLSTRYNNTYTFHTLQQHIHLPHIATTHTLSTCYNNTYTFDTLQQHTQKQNPKLKYYLPHLFHILWLLKNFFTSLFCFPLKYVEITCFKNDAIPLGLYLLTNIILHLR